MEKVACEGRDDLIEISFQNSAIFNGSGPSCGGSFYNYVRFDSPPAYDQSMLQAAT